MPSSSKKRVRIGFIGVGQAAHLRNHAGLHEERAVFKDPGNGATPLTVIPDLPWVHAIKNQTLNFIKTVRGDASAPCLAPEALQDLRVARNYTRL